MLLDGMLASPSTTWLATPPEKAHGLRALCPSIPADALPHVTVGNNPSRAVRPFLDRLPVGIDSASRVALPYLVASVVTDDVRAFLEGQRDLLRPLPEWTVRLATTCGARCRDRRVAFFALGCSCQASPRPGDVST